MPTGYTAGILDGEITTFQQFAKICMRAFGATIHLRDEPLSKQYEPRVPSAYYLENVEKEKKALKDAEIISDEDLIKQHLYILDKEKKYHLEAIDKKNQNLIKLNQIMNDATLFVPPTTEHTGFKDYMINQLQMTIDSDGSTKYHDNCIAKIEKQLLNIDATEIRNNIIAESAKSLAYYQKAYNEEVKRCQDANKWVTDLLQSVQQPYE